MYGLKTFNLSASVTVRSIHKCRVIGNACDRTTKKLGKIKAVNPIMDQLTMRAGRKIDCPCGLSLPPITSTHREKQSVFSQINNFQVTTVKIAQ